MTERNLPPSNAAAQRDLLIFGAGTFAQLAAVYFRGDSPYRVVGLTVDRAHLPQGRVADLEVIPFEEVATRFPPERTDMFAAVGYSDVNRARERVCRRCRDAGYRLASYVSSHAVRVGDTEIGENCFVFEQAVLQPFVRLGDDVTVWTGAFVGHHSIIEDHCFIAGHAALSGHVRIGHHSFVGTNATVRDGVSVAPSTVIGAGTTIVRDTSEGSVYVGTPGRATGRGSADLDRI